MSWRSSLVSFFFFLLLCDTQLLFIRAKLQAGYDMRPIRRGVDYLLCDTFFVFHCFFCCFVCVRFQTLSSSIHVTPPMPTVGVLETDSRVFSLFISLFKKRLKRAPRGLFGFLVSETVLYCLFTLSSMLKCVYLSDTR